MPNLTIILGGVLGVGKTTIFKRIETGEFVQSPNPAVVSKSDLEAKHFIYTNNIEGKDYKVTLWDTGGLERYDSMTSNYFRYCHAVILVYNSSPEQIHTLFALKEWIEQTKSLSQIGNCVMFSLWDNRIDINSSDDRSTTTGMTRLPEVNAFLEEYSIPESLHFSVSALTGENIMESFQSFLVQINDTLNDVKTASITLSSEIGSQNSEPHRDELIPQESQRPRSWHKKICSKC